MKRKHNPQKPITVTISCLESIAEEIQTQQQLQANRERIIEIKMRGWA